MPQNKIIPAVSVNSLVFPKAAISNPNNEGRTYTPKRKLVGVTVATLGGAGSNLQLYDNVDASDATKLIYQVDGTVAHPQVELNFPFTQLYAKVNTGGVYNIIIN